MDNGYVLLAYIAFAVILAWDFLAPRIRLGQVRRAIVRRAARDDARKQR